MGGSGHDDVAAVWGHRGPETREDKSGSYDSVVSNTSQPGTPATPTSPPSSRTLAIPGLGHGRDDGSLRTEGASAAQWIDSDERRDGVEGEWMRSGSNGVVGGEEREEGGKGTQRGGPAVHVPLVFSM